MIQHRINKTNPKNNQTKNNKKDPKKNQNIIPKRIKNESTKGSKTKIKKKIIPKSIKHRFKKKSNTNDPKNN